jgi:hypothetical protein
MSSYPKLAFNLERDLRVLVAMAAHLTPYLYESEMYGQLSGDMPKLTLGGLLLRLYRLSHMTLNDAQQNQVREAQRQFETARSEWSAHYDSKLQQELRTRLDASNQFLVECGEDVQMCAASYPSQAEKRMMIEHLKDEAQSHGVLSDDAQLRLRQVDNKLQRYLKEGEFISDARLQAVYPPDKFWWMYGHIAED